MNISQMIGKFFEYWTQKGCMYLPASSYTMGAATFHPQLFWGIKNSSINNFVYLQPCMRRADGMYGKSSNRLALHHQLQVIMQPVPSNFHEMAYEFFASIGLTKDKYLMQEIDSQWNSESLGASGDGWEVRANTLEIMQYTYFDKFAHRKLTTPVGELAIGLERVAVVQQGLPIMECEWSMNVKYGDLFFEQERQLSQYYLDTPIITKDQFEECVKLTNKCEQPVVKYEYFLKMNDIYNCLNARNLLTYEEMKKMMKQMSKISDELYT